MRQAGDRIGGSKGESVEQPYSHHAVHRSAQRPRCEADIGFGRLADSVAEQLPQFQADGFTCAIKEKQRQDRESDE
jgi:hypothetical protein